jgi:hypothetical protein
VLLLLLMMMLLLLLAAVAIIVAHGDFVTDVALQMLFLLIWMFLN